MNVEQIYKKFPKECDCIAYLEEIIWNGQPKCPYCNSLRVTPVSKEYRHHCNRCNTTFSITINTIFHGTRLDLQKWFLAICIIRYSKKKFSARELARNIQVNPNTAWYMNIKINKAILQNIKLVEWISKIDDML